MRIRSIKPDFWTSETMAKVSERARLTFIGLWSYVDDNGVGIDNEMLIVAALYPLSGDPLEGLRKTGEDLRSLSAVGVIQRYEVDGRRYIFCRSWDEHQKVSHPRATRYPRPSADALTCDDRETPEGLWSSSGEAPESLPKLSAVSREQGAGSREQGGDSGRKRPATRLPADWVPTEKHQEYAKEHGLDISREVFKFRNHADANDRRQVAWNGAFSTWLANAEEWAGGKRAQRPVLRDPRSGIIVER